MFSGGTVKQILLFKMVRNSIYIYTHAEVPSNEEQPSDIDDCVVRMLEGFIEEDDDIECDDDLIAPSYHSHLESAHEFAELVGNGNSNGLAGEMMEEEDELDGADRCAISCKKPVTNKFSRNRSKQWPSD